MQLPLHSRGTPTCNAKKSAKPSVICIICTPLNTVSSASTGKEREKTQKIRRKCATIAPYLAASSHRRSFASPSSPSPSKISSLPIS